MIEKLGSSLNGGEGGGRMGGRQARQPLPKRTGR